MAVVVAAAVIVGGTGTAGAATIGIGTLSLISDGGGGVFLEITNDTNNPAVGFQPYFGEYGVFTNLNLRTWTSAESAASESALSTDVQDWILMGNGSVRYTTSAATLLAGVQDPIAPALLPYTQYLSSFSGAFTVLTFDLFGERGTPYAGVSYVEPLDITSCTDALLGDICGSSFISYETAPGEVAVPEPATIALLASGLGALVLRRRRAKRV